MKHAAVAVVAAAAAAAINNGARPMNGVLKKKGKREGDAIMTDFWSRAL